MIHFNIPPFVGSEIGYIQEAIQNHKICGDGIFTKQCSEELERLTGTKKALLTTSGTHALEMAALLCNIQPGDEVIMPSYTFVSTANAFVLRGGKCVFVDIRPDTMNIDEKRIESAITEKTKVIAPVHYAGVSCEMTTIMNIANKYKLKVVEDAAQGIFASYKGTPLGVFGDYGCFSFHETKNISMGEGGALLIRDKVNVDRAEIIREKGTDRSRFFRGQVDKYTWVDQGSSYLSSELNAAYLWAQLEKAQDICQKRHALWSRYHNEFEQLESQGVLTRPTIPDGCKHNAHMYYIKLGSLSERTRFITYMKQQGILAVFHYIPLHSSPAGKTFGRFSGEDRWTTKESERLVRLPLYYSMTKQEQTAVIHAVKDFFYK